MEIKIALAQMSLVPGDPDANLEAARGLAARAAAAGAGLLMLPELWTTGYDLSNAGALAAPLDAGHFRWMADLAVSHGLYVLGSAMEATATGRPCNTAALYGPRGERLAEYRKVHLFPPLGEVKHFTPGGELPVFDLPWGRTALAICYDLRFPEMWRRLMLAGARLVLIPAEWPIRRVEHWRLLLRARAIENQFFVAGCNRCSQGSDAPDPFGGYSGAVDPWGHVLVEADGTPALVHATLDLAEVERCRATFPWLADRRPEVYQAASL